MLKTVFLKQFSSTAQSVKGPSALQPTHYKKKKKIFYFVSNLHYYFYVYNLLITTNISFSNATQFEISQFKIQCTFILFNIFMERLKLELPPPPLGVLLAEGEQYNSLCEILV